MWRANFPPRTRAVLITSALHVNIVIFAKCILVIKPRNVFIQGYTDVSEVTSVEHPPSSGFPRHTDGQQHDLYVVAVEEVDDARQHSVDLDGSFLHDFDD